MGNNPKFPINIRRVNMQDTLLVNDYFQSLSEKTKSIFSGSLFTLEEAARLTGAELNDVNIRRFIASASIEGIAEKRWSV